MVRGTVCVGFLVKLNLLKLVGLLPQPLLPCGSALLHPPLHHAALMCLYLLLVGVRPILLVRVLFDPFVVRLALE